MNSCQGLDQRIAALLEPRREVLEACRFGSHARGDAQPHSDLDIAVYIDEEAAERSAFGYRAQLATERPSFEWITMRTPFDEADLGIFFGTSA